MTINFYLESGSHGFNKKKNKPYPKRKNPELLISLWIRFHTKLLKVGTGELIHPNHWNKETQRPKKGVSGAVELTDLLDSWEEEIKKVAREAKIMRIDITKDYLQDNLTFITKKDSSFFAIWDKWIKEESKAKKWEPGTLTRYEQCRNILLEIDKKLGFGSMNNDFLLKFLEYHRNEGEGRKKKEESYTSKNYTILKGFLSWTVDNDHNTSLAFRKWNPVFEKIDSEENIFFLTIDERDRLLNLDIKDDTARSVRDAFIFSCYTALRYSDLKNLKKDNVKNGKIVISTVKTSKSISIKLTKVAKDILSRYKDMLGPDALPVVSNQAFNKHLRVLAKQAGLNHTITLVSFPGGERQEKIYPKYEKISCHWGRKTFLTTSIFHGNSLETTAEIAGITIEVVRRYYKIQDTRKDEAMDKFDE